MQARKDRKLIFEPPTATEHTRIRQGLSQYMPVEDVENFLKGKYILVGRGRRNEVYLLTRALLELYQKISTHRHPYFTGLYLGELENETFEPSLHVLRMLTAKAKEKVIVRTTDEGEQHFLYGHNLSLNHLQDPSLLAEMESRVIITNQRGEGIGFCDIATKGTQKPELIRLKDLGWYLRRGW